MSWIGAIGERLPQRPSAGGVLTACGRAIGGLDWRARVGLLVLGVAVFSAIFAPVLAPFDPYRPSGAPDQAPSSAHWLGTDDGGVDMLSLLLYGARISLVVGIVAALLSGLVGGGIGIVSGYVGGRVDGLLMRITDYFLVLPTIPLMIALTAIWTPSLFSTILVIGLLSWSGTARVIRAQVKTLRRRTYVQRARSLGAGHVRIVRDHVVPQLGPLLVANTVLNIAGAVFAETALSFLGLGDPTRPSWGVIMSNAFISTAVSNGYWWEIVPAGMCVSIVVFACSLTGSALEDRLNPRLRVGHVSIRRFRTADVPRDQADADAPPPAPPELVRTTAE